MMRHIDLQEAIMQEDVARKIEEAPIPGELKAALGDIMEWIEAQLPAAPLEMRYRLGFARRRLLAEATEPEVDTLFWEVALDFVAKAAREQGPAGQPALDAIQRITPLLRERFGPQEEVTLREITDKTVFGICLLSETLTEPKRHFVAPNAISLAQAHFHPHAWFRAIYAGRAPVGFMMMVDNPDEPEYFLWRFMLAEPYHGRGYAREAIERLVEYVHTRPGARELGVSCGLGEGSPEGFYLKAGFVSTGEMDEGELVLIRSLE
jgi:diamine N-acetyltransferase